MWKRSVALAAVLMMMGWPATSWAAVPAASCADDESPQFANGLGALSDVLGEIMGDPLECEHVNADNGDTLQQTSAGLALYRRATTWPEFTDGYHHWALVGSALVAWVGSEDPLAAPAAPLPTAPRCVGVGDGACLLTTADLVDTVGLLAQTSTAGDLARGAAHGGYTVRYGAMPPGVLGVFRPRTHDVVLSAELHEYPSSDVVPILAHELQHVSDWLMDRRAMQTSSGCLATEDRAFHTEAATWLEVSGGRVRNAANDIERELNAVTRAIASDPDAFADRLTRAYHSECGAG